MHKARCHPLCDPLCAHGLDDDEDGIACEELPEVCP